MNWNFNISEAPRGRTEIHVRKIGDDERKTEVFVPERILAANKDGKVYATYWTPPNKWTKAGRWAGWSEGEVPLAWMPWPDHPLPKAEAAA